MGSVGSNNREKSVNVKAIKEWVETGGKRPTEAVNAWKQAVDSAPLQMKESPSIASDGKTSGSGVWNIDAGAFGKGSIFGSDHGGYMISVTDMNGKRLRIAKETTGHKNDFRTLAAAEKEIRKILKSK